MSKRFNKFWAIPLPPVSRQVALRLCSVLIAGLCLLTCVAQLASFLSMTCHIDTKKTILIKIGFGIDDFREFNCMWNDICLHFDVDESQATYFDTPICL